MKLIEFALLIVAIVLIVKALKFLAQRLSLLKSIRDIKKIDGAEVEICSILSLL